MRQEIFLTESTFSADSLTMFIHPLCAIACINICTQCQKSQTPAPIGIPLLGVGHTKILHTLVAVSSATLAAAVPYPGMGTRISCKGQRNTKPKKLNYVNSEAQTHSPLPPWWGHLGACLAPKLSEPCPPSACRTAETHTGTHTHRDTHTQGHTHTDIQSNAYI